MSLHLLDILLVTVIANIASDREHAEESRLS